MEAESIAEAAGLLLDAYASGVPVAPLTAAYPGLSVTDAYSIQLAQVATWTAGGARVKGHKVGLTSAAMQRQLGVDHPVFGHLLDTMFLAEGTAADYGRLAQPKAEPEIAFVLGRPLRGPGVTVAEALTAVDFVLPALEIVDSRIEGTGAGGAVLGSPVNALVWLANTIGPLGITLAAGHVVLPGSVCAAISFGPGDTVSATFDHIGSVSVTFSEKS